MSRWGASSPLPNTGVPPSEMPCELSSARKAKLLRDSFLMGAKRLYARGDADQGDCKGR
jgi:hypothetical protein